MSLFNGFPKRGYTGMEPGPIRFAARTMSANLGSGVQYTSAQVDAMSQFVNLTFVPSNGTIVLRPAFAGDMILLYNNGAGGQLIYFPNGKDTIDGSTASQTLNQNIATILFCVADGAWVNLGLGTKFALVNTTGSQTVTGAKTWNNLSTYAAGIAFSGATGVNLGTFPDNLAEAMWFGEATNRYLTFVSTNGSEACLFTKKVAYDATDSTASPGAATVNKPSGQAKIALGASSVVITNSMVTTASIVLAVLQGTDATVSEVISVVPGSGSFTITVGKAGIAANTTAALQVGWIVYN